jgi:hypothetical protein
LVGRTKDFLGGIKEMMTAAQYDRLERIARLLCQEDKTRARNSRKQWAKLREMLDARKRRKMSAETDPSGKYPWEHRSEEG